MISSDRLQGTPVTAFATQADHRTRAALSRNAVMVLTETAVLVLAMQITSGLAHASALMPAAITLLAVRLLLGLVPGRGLHPHEIMRRSVAAVPIAAGICIMLPALQGDTDHAVAIALFLLVALVLQYPARMMAVALLHRAGLWTINAHVIADPAISPLIETFFRRNWRYGLMPDASRPASVALVADDALARPEALPASYAQVFVLADTPQLRISGLHAANAGGAIGLRVKHLRPGIGADRVKRAMDLAIAVPMMVVALPFIALAALAIWIVDPGPVFYAQPREGLNGSVLKVLKLRTMYSDAETRLQDLLQADPEARAEWAAHFKLKKDPRVLPFVGCFLRRSSIDELPQLLNVIMGGMSVVGPRPFPEYHLAAMRPEFRRKRCSVPPGITGLWQISERSQADLAQQEQLDAFYIDNRSVWLDLSILLRTLPAVILGRGAC